MFRKKKGGAFLGSGKFLFSLTEIWQLLFSALVISVIFAYPYPACSGLSDTPCIALSTALLFLIVGSAFIVHESSHKLTAQYFGVWSEYRMWAEGLILALVMKILAGFSFIAPGAAYFEPYKRKGPLSAFFAENYLTKDEVGKIGLAGPLSNVVLALLFFALSPFLGPIAYAGIEINLALAMFNLIPIHPIDGAKIFSWSWQVWLALLGLVFAFQFFLVPY